MRISAGAVLALAAVACVGAVGYAVYVKRRDITGAVSDVVDAINPASDQNLAYKAANAITQAITGDSGATLGTKLFEWINPTQAALDVALTAPTTRGPSAAALINARDNDLAQFGLPPVDSVFNISPGGAATGRRVLH